MSKFSHSLARKLGLDIMLLAAPVFILSLGLFYFQSRYLIRQEAIERSNSILESTMYRVQNYMGSIVASTEANAWLMEESFCPDSLQSISQRMVRLNPFILSCSVCAVPDMFPQYGHHFSVYTINEDHAITTVIENDFEYTEKPWYKLPYAKGRACWVEPFSEHAEGTIDHNEAVATYCRPLRSADGRTVGVVSADFSFSQLAKTIMDAEHSYQDAYFMLLGGNGRYFIHPETAKLFRKTIFTDADPDKHADRIALGYEMTEGKQGTMHVDINGQRCHVCYLPVPGTDWSLAMVCPDSEILEGYHRQAYIVAVIILIGLLFMWWLCNKVVRQTTKPIHQLLSMTKQIAEGNYDATIPTTDQQDDIGRLQNGFAVMQQSLRDHMGSISRTAEEISKRNEEHAREMELAEEAVRKKTVFIQNLSHQIRTPLNIIQGFANVLLEKIVSRDKGMPAEDLFEAENLNDITGMMKYNAIHLKRMVLMLFDSSATVGADYLMGNRKDQISCNDVARESINYTLGNFQRLEVKFDSDLSDAVQIVTNHLYLMRSIRELLYNAAKYSDGKHIRLHVTETETTVRFIVEDVGPGLSENSEELIYKPFMKMDDLSEGLGLGLPLTKRHALALGGDLIYDKDYPDGCRFILEVPK